MFLRFHHCLFLSLVCVALPLVTPASAADDAELTSEQLKFFETKIRPVMVSECYGCHSKQSGQRKGGLQVDTRDALLLGGDSGPAIVPGDLDSSLFYGAITHNDFVMPPKRKLSDAQIADFKKWILDGAPDPRVAKAVDAPTQTIDDETIAEAKATFWAYQEPEKLTPVASKSGQEWAKSEIDLFLFDTLENSGLTPAADADGQTILRRLCFDLVGLPPTPEQVEWFQGAYAMDADAAIERVVDRLMDSDQFGERWGRHWLDVVRYAESTGREVNMTYPHAWRYRDYVIDAFNNDKSFDEFVQEQIAGDLLPAKTDSEWTEHLIATTFLAIGTKNVNEQSGAQFAADVADEQIDATTRVFLGTSVACARCHDHKFDPIRQSDYYAMAGIFRSTKTFFGTPPSEYGTINGPQVRRTSSLILLPESDPSPFDKSYTKDELDDMHSEMERLRESLVDLRRNNPRGGTGNAANAQQMRIRLTNQMGALSAKLGVVDENGRPKSYCMGVQDAGSVGDATLLVRGEIDQPAGRISRGVPGVFSDQPLSIKRGQSGRRELAEWIGSADNTLSARVMVNRLWTHVFGQGIVPTTEDFGMTGTYPSHPELLDHLTVEFIESGWSMKSMIRKMMLTRAYRMSSDFSVTAHEKDPDNRLLWRSHVKRLGAESIRDAMLVVADELDTYRPRGSRVAEAGYTRVRSEQLGDPREMIRRSIGQALVSRQQQFRSRFQGRFPNRNQIRGQLGDREVARIANDAYNSQSLDSASANYRSVYLPVVRDFVPRSLEVFDFADPSMVTGVREASNTPNQALFMLNNPLTMRLSEQFAARVMGEKSRSIDRVNYAFVLAYGRPPSREERAASMAYLNNCGLATKPAFESFCQSLFAAAEFRYLN